MRRITEAVTIFLALCLSIPAPSRGERPDCPPPSPPPEGPIFISTEGPPLDGPVPEEVLAAIRARLEALETGDGPELPESEIRGQVVDDAGRGVRSQVFFKNIDSPSFEKRETWTDDEGRFTVTGFPAEQFIVWTVEPGETRFAVSLVEVRERGARTMKLLLRPYCPDPAEE